MDHYEINTFVYLGCLSDKTSTFKRSLLCLPLLGALILLKLNAINTKETQIHIPRRCVCRTCNPPAGEFHQRCEARNIHHLCFHGNQQNDQGPQKTPPPANSEQIRPLGSKTTQGYVLKQLLGRFFAKDSRLTCSE